MLPASSPEAASFVSGNEVAQLSVEPRHSLEFSPDAVPPEAAAAET